MTCALWRHIQSGLTEPYALTCALLNNVYVCICDYSDICIYIYIYRERERDR